MKTKDTSSSFPRKFLEGVELSADEQEGAYSVLEVLEAHPDVLSRQEPPLGYEEKLLASLRRQLPLDSQKAPTSVETPRRRALLLSPRLSWSLAAVFAGVAVFSFWTQTTRQGIEAEPDLLVQSLPQGHGEEVDAWAASLGDRVQQKRISRADLDLMAQDLVSFEDQKKIDEVLKQVARTMGMD